MSELSSARLTAFQTVIEPLAEAFAMSLSENINQLAVFDPPVITQESISALISDPEPVIQTSFTFPTLCEDEAAVLFSESDSHILADIIGMGDGSEPPEMLEEEHIERLSAAMAGFVQGIGTAIGNVLSQPVAPGPGCSTKLVPMTLSAGFLTAGYAVQIAFPYRVEGLIDGTFRILVTPDTARAITPGVEEELPGEQNDIQAINAAEVPPAQAGAAPGISMAGATPASDFGTHSFQPFEVLGGVQDAMPRGMDIIMDIPLDVSVELGRVQMLIKDVLELATGSIVELERVAGEPIDLMVNGQLIAKGEVVVIEDNFGIRITEIVSPSDRLNTAGKRAA